MEKNGNWSVITRNCPELVRKFYLFNKIFKKMKNRESGKWPGNAGKFPGFWDNWKVTKNTKKSGILGILFPGFPVSRFFCSNFPDEISRFPGFGQTFLDFPVSRIWNFPNISREFPGFMTCRCAQRWLVPIRGKIMAFDRLFADHGKYHIQSKLY